MPMRLGLLGVVVAGVIGTAAAQPMQMPDVSQMSGTPRPDPAVAAGTLTVKVIRGELAAWAPIGTRVHLVAMSSKGEVSLVTREVNDEGRAEFTGLATDGLTAYYALSALGADRLISQPVVLPPRVGVRMMLAGAKAGEPPVDDEGREHEGVHEAPSMPRAGEVEVLVRGRVDGKARLVLRPLTGGERREVDLEAKDDALRALVTGVPAGHVYLPEVMAGGEVLRSTPFMTTATAGVRRMVLGYDGLLFSVQGGAQADDEAFWLELRMMVANVSPAPFDPGPGGLLLPLPAGSHSAKLQDEEPTMALEEGGLRTRRPVPPGQLSADVLLALPIDGGQVAVSMPAPLGMFQSQLAVLKLDGMTLTPPPGTRPPEVRRSDDGREYYVLSELQVAPGEALRFTVAGLPVAAAWEGWMRLFVGVLVTLLVALGVAAAVRRPTATVTTPASGPDARRQLGQRRERLYAELMALERLRVSQRIEAGEFDAKRRAIMTKLVLVHRELDDLEAGA